ncbi:MAG: peptidylprolyl isomerase [Haloferacaceae archaeon]
MTDDEAEPATDDEPAVDTQGSEATDDENETGTDEGLENGDFVRLEYTVRTADDGRIVDTTREEVAAEAGIDEEEHDFSPRTIVVGAGHVFRSVDEDLAGRTVGEENTVTVPPDEAFGEFDPDQVRTVSVEKIPEDDRYPGAQVQIDGEQGYVETIIGGRARVDFNHPLAGDELEYEYEIVGEIEERTEKARGLLGMYLEDVPEVRIETDEVEEEVEVEAEEGEEDESETEVRTVEKETLYIEATPMMAMNQQWIFQKQQVAQQLMTRIDVDRVVVEEVLEGPGGGGLGGMMGMGGGGGVEAEDLEAAIEDVDLDEDVDADEIVEELDAVDE